ncbi:MAG TPA: hypothetical protein VHG34_04410, partial [Nitrososphaeraceae archaeon]|nr:hypothetical protein [Nitrososphaeraceae archaeon]
MALFAIAASKLSKDLGYGMPVSSIISSVSFIACLFFYLYIIGSFFKVPVYPLVDRAVLYILFQGHVINEYVDNITAIVAAIFWILFSLNNRGIRYSLSIAYGGIGTILAVISPVNIIFDIIALLSMPLIIGISLYYYYSHHRRHYNEQQKKKILNFDAKLTLRYISLAVIAMSVIGIAVPVSAVFLSPNLDSSAGRTAISASFQASPQTTLFLLLSSFSTVYIFLLLSCLGVKALFKVGLRRLKLNIKEDISEKVSDDYYYYYKQNKVKTQTKIGFLLLAIVLSIVLVLIPQHPLVNKDNQNIGVDTTYYVYWIGELSRSKNVFDLIYQSFVIQGQDGDRPLSLLFLFLLYQAAGNTNLSDVIEHFPLILGPGIVLALYFLTLELTRNEKIALIAAFFAAVYIHTLVGIYAGFYANWLGLIVGYISLAFLFRYLRTGRPSDMVAFSTLLIGVLFIHVYTWTVLAAVAGIFLLAMLLVHILDKKKKKNKNKNNANNNNIIISSSGNNNNNPLTNRKRIIWLLVAILISVGVDITKALLTGSSGGLIQDAELAQTNLGIEQFNTRFDTLDLTMHGSLGGVFSNFIILILGLFWVLKSNIREPSTIFLMIFLSVGLIPLNIGSWTLQVRVFYDMPFE